MEPFFCCNSKIFRSHNLISFIRALLLFLGVGRTWAIQGNVAFATTFEAGLQVSIRTITRHVTSLVAVVAEVRLIAVLGKVARVVALEAPGLLLSAILCKVAASVTLQTPQTALLRPSATSCTVSGKVPNSVAKVALQRGRVLLSVS